MSKIQLSTVNSGYNLGVINQNFQKIQTEINNKMLSRNPEGEPNTMLDILDMNSKEIINLPKPETPTEPVRLKDIAGFGTNSYIGPSAPADAIPGTLWWNTVIPALFIYYNDGDSIQWIEVLRDPNSLVISSYPPSPGIAGFWLNADTLDLYAAYPDEDSVQWVMVSSASALQLTAEAVQAAQAAAEAAATSAQASSVIAANAAIQAVNAALIAGQLNKITANATALSNVLNDIQGSFSVTFPLTGDWLEVSKTLTAAPTLLAGVGQTIEVNSVSDTTFTWEAEMQIRMLFVKEGTIWKWRAN